MGVLEKGALCIGVRRDGKRKAGGRCEDRRSCLIAGLADWEVAIVQGDCKHCVLIELTFWC